MGMDHEEKYQRFIIKRCCDVINSCTDYKQLVIALRYCRNFKNVYYGFDVVRPDIWDAYKAKLVEFGTENLVISDEYSI